MRIVLIAVILAAAAHGEDDTVKTISHGEKVELQQHFQPGKYAVLEFYADSWGVCKQLGPQYEAAVRKRTDTILLKIDIAHWLSDVSKQFNVQQLPQLIVYRPDGTIVKQGNDPAMLDDPTRDDTAGGGIDIGVLGAIIIATVAVLLFVLTKVLGPKPSGSRAAS